MKNPADFLDPNKLKEQPQSESVNETKNLSADHIDELWRRMARIYGIAWNTMYGTYDDDTWLRGLSDFTPEDLAVGLEACAKQKPDEHGKFWAPSLPQFKSMCKPKDTKPSCHEIYPGLPKPQISKEDALAHLAKIRESLK